MNLADNITRILSKRSIKQADLASALGISRSSVCSWMKGDSLPSIDNLVRMSEILNTSVDDILKGDTSRISAPCAISMDEGLNYDIIIIDGREFYKFERDDSKPLKHYMTACYGKGWKRAVHYVICQNILDGIVICVNNHTKGEAEIIGTTEGYA